MKKMVMLSLAATLSFGDSNADGQSLGRQYNSVFGSQNGMNSRLFKPITGGGNMTTLDGTKSFNGTIQCASKEKAASITFLPSSGGEYRLIIAQDTDLNGNMDYTYDTGAKNISGFCGNGIISCSPGTWSNCTSYQWVSSNGKVSLQNVPNGSQSLAGCQCSNASCDPAQGLFSSMKDTIAGSISATVMAEGKTIFVKSQWNVTAMTYDFYAQSQTSCTGLGTSGSTSNLSSAWSNKSTPTLSSVSSTLLSDPSSPYSQANAVGTNPSKATLEAQAKGNVTASANQVFTVAENDTQFTYTDMNGNTKVLMNTQNASSCPTPACTVKRPKIDTVQFSDGSNRSQVSGSSTYEVFIKACDTALSTPKCALETNEILIEDCTCSGSTNQTVQAIGTMKVMQNVAKQYTCNTN